jgi:5-methyltetrahydropteroyltriglutamate--homocysteine methyltransferase
LSIAAALVFGPSNIATAIPTKYYCPWLRAYLQWRRAFEEQRDERYLRTDFIQLTELVFTQGQTRTFMYAALAVRNDPTEELEFAVTLLNRVLEGVDGVRTGLHICRGNWSQAESTLLRGSYHPLAPYLERIHGQQLVLEYATERAGDLMRFAGKELGLGVVNLCTPAVESPDAIKASIEQALRLYPADQVFLNPHCGFGTCSNRPVNSAEVALKKLRAIVAAARSL